MLTFAEELLLLVLDKNTGDLALAPERGLNHAMAGAALLDLAIKDRIDTDLETLTVVDSAPLGDEVLDPVLARLAEAAEPHAPERWVRRLAGDGERIRRAALRRLVEAGVLRSADEGAIEPTTRVARARKYPTVDGRAEQEVRLRIMRVLFSDDMPRPRDAVIICLADACGVFKRMLGQGELEEAGDRIDLVGHLDLLGQAVTRAVREAGEEAGEDRRPPPRTPPVAKGLPLVGNIREACGDIGRFLSEQHVKLGPVFEVRILRRKLLVLAGEEANRFVNRQGRRYLSSRETWRGFPEGLRATRVVMSMEGQEHFAMRKAFAPSMGRARFNEFFDAAAGTALRHAAALPQGRPLRPLPFLQKIVAEQMGEILASHAASDQVEDMATMLEILLATKVTKQLPMFLFARKFNRARARVEAVAKEVLDAHRPGGPLDGAGDMISDLIELNRRDPQLMPETDMWVWAIAPYIVGIETVANTCAFVLYGILKHPEVKEKAVAEVDDFFAGAPTAKGLAQLDATRRATMEAMRLWPAAPVLYRAAANSFDFAGCHVPAGTQLFIPTVATHHLAEHFPEPERFDIDRYLPDRAEHKQPHAYVPFGAGVHRCPGGGFAEGQILLIVAALLRAVELELHPRSYELKVSGVPTPRPAQSFKVAVKRRRVDGPRGRLHQGEGR